MPKLTISGKTFNYPDPGTEAGWGEDATGWAAYVTAALNAIVTAGDILPTLFNIANNQTLTANITGLSISANLARSAVVTYDILRKSSGTPAGISEDGEIHMEYNADAAIGSKWAITQVRNGNAGVNITCTDAGQFQYTSTDIGGTITTSTIKFAAKIMPK